MNKDKICQEDSLDNNKEPKFNVDFSKMIFEVGDIWHREHEPKTGFGIYRDIKDTKGVPYRVWLDHNEYYLANMTNGDTLKHFDNEKELINYYFGNYDPSKPEG